MHLLFLSTFYPPYELGGLDQLCHEVSERRAARSSCDCLDQSPWHGWTLRPRSGYAPVLYFAGRSRLLSACRCVPEASPTGTSNAQALHAAIAGNRPDLLVVEHVNCRAAALLGRAVAARPRRLLCCEHLADGSRHTRRIGICRVAKAQRAGEAPFTSDRVGRNAPRWVSAAISLCPHCVRQPLHA